MMSGRKQTVWCQQTDNDDDDGIGDDGGENERNNSTLGKLIKNF